MNLRHLLKNTLVQSLAVLAVSAAIFLAISPPIPSSLFTFYMTIIVLGLAVYVTATTRNMESFWAPVRALLVAENLRWPRWIAMVAIPLAAGFLSALALIPLNTAPLSLRVIHPAPPESIQFRGKAINLGEAQNPLRAVKAADPKAFAGHVENGKKIYYGNCFFCHGDHLAGRGPFARAFNPQPADFQDVGTIAQLQESYLFWRIAKGGPGLPDESWPGRSAMPKWEDILSEEEIWAVILFLYEKTGHPPRTWE